MSEAKPKIPKGYLRLEGSERHPSSSAKLLGPAVATETFKITIVLRRRPDGPPIPDFEYYAKVPPNKRRRLSGDEFARKYGAAPADVARVVQFLRAHGLAVIGTHTGRRTVVASGTVAQMNETFAVTLGRYKHSVVRRRGQKSQTETYRGRDGFIYLPNDLAEIVVGVFGLDNRNITMAASSDPANTTTQTVQTVTGLYKFPTNSADGQTIAIFSAALDGYLLSDLQTYFASPTPPILPDITVDGWGNDNCADLETTQDICIAASAAPGAKIQVYFTTSDQIGWVDLITRVVHPDPGDPICSVLSSSFYVAGGDDAAGLSKFGVTISWLNAVTAAFQDAALQGVTVCIASGDTGADCRVGDGYQHVLYPASDPWVLACGGTTIGNITGGTFDEWVWNDIWTLNDAPGATGGGVSAFFPQPSYQSSANVPASLRSGGGTGRGVPDVAANSSPNSGYPITVGGVPAVGNGTSVAAPLYAGLIAVINAALGYNVGFLNPTLYALGETVCRDVNPLEMNPAYGFGGPTNNNFNGVTGYPAGPGWDACTGWGSIVGTALLTALQLGTQKDCYFIVDWGTFAKAGVDEMLSQPNGAVFNPAFYVVAEGFTPADLGIGTANPVQPVISFSPNQPSGMTVQLIGGAQPDGTPVVPSAPQRWTFTYMISFTDHSGFPTPPTEIEPIILTAKIIGAVTGDAVTSSAVIELTDESAPFMTAGSVSWLSNDIRVFQIESGQSPGWAAGVSMYNTGNPANDATSYIQALIQAYNNLASTKPPNHPFDSIPTGEAASTLDTLPTDPSTNNPVYNFAVARVRYQDPKVDAKNVRLFFRTFPAAAISTAYDQSTTYRRWSDGAEFGENIPLLGSQYDPTLGQQLETIPFFAQPRINTTTLSMDRQTDQLNVQTIAHDPSDAVVYAYYGCWLDINQPTQKPFPQTPSGDGPFTGTTTNPLVPVFALFASQHQCITAEIAYDPTPIAPGATPGSSLMLGQRNLSLLPIANPGDSASRLVPNPFQMRPTAANLPPGAIPDQLMIDWGSTPVGSVATLYLPAASAADIILQAAAIPYGRKDLTLVDTHTLQFPTRGITYIPIPQNAGGNLASLFSVELPPGVRKGQEFNILVRQLTSVSEDVENPRGVYEQGRPMIEWQRVLGTFQVKISVLTKAEMLAPEERLLSVFRWVLKTHSKQSRWYPVISRYVSQIEARVQALGGNPGLVLPSPTGTWQEQGLTLHRGEKPPVEFTGKVAGLVYDHFGDFDGFLLEVEEGERAFASREKEVEELVRHAWLERVLTTVFADHDDLRRPRSIVLRRSPSPFKG